MAQNTATIARRMASQWWGPVQKQEKLGDGIWWFTTASHGGLVVDTDVRTALAEFKSTVLLRKDGEWARSDEQHFAAFEEDCDAALVEWVYPSIMDKTAKSCNIGSNLIDQWKVQRKQMLFESLSRWHADWLASHPFACGESNPKAYEIDTLLSRDGKKIGYIRSWDGHHCTMEGCTGRRICVRWQDGTVTYPCSKGIESTGTPGVWKIC